MKTYYRVKLTNTKTNESRLTMLTFTSRKKAEEWAEEFKKSVPIAKVEVLKF